MNKPRSKSTISFASGTFKRRVSVQGAARPHSRSNSMIISRQKRCSVISQNSMVASQLNSPTAEARAEMDEKTNKLGRLPPIKSPDILLHSNSVQIQSLHPQVYISPLCSIRPLNAAVVSEFRKEGRAATHLGSASTVARVEYSERHHERCRLLQPFHPGWSRGQICPPSRTLAGAGATAGVHELRAEGSCCPSGAAQADQIPPSKQPRRE